MNPRKFILLSLIAVIFFWAAHFYNKYYHRNVRKHPTAYVYETYRGPANPALVIDRLKFKDSLVAYYQQVSKGENPYFNFPLKTLPVNDTVYIMGYTKDSLLAEVVSYFDRGPRFGGSYWRGYVYTGTLHAKPANKR